MENSVSSLKLEGGAGLGGRGGCSDELPLVSVVTVVFNDVDHLQRTIDSVTSQSYRNIEHIVIDGGSTDGTLAVIQQNPSISYWVSEKDGGIYDAMNKGVSVASGEWVNFMNSGDVFYRDSVISEIFSVGGVSSNDLVYGDVEIDYGPFTKIRKAGVVESLKSGMQFSHQSLFARRAVLELFKFDLSYRTAADYNFVLLSWVSGFRFNHVELVVSSISAGGISDVRRLESHKQRVKILNSHLDLSRVDRVWAGLQGLYIRVSDFLKFIMPVRLVDWIKKLK
ncbi:hypothetical protein ALP39_200013 [Pseudomonas marginalis pv. marginalis]|nr:hypothetical protein ALP39_200013 [Pseudomonas marginalis pv. marginalis]